MTSVNLTNINLTENRRINDVKLVSVNNGDRSQDTGSFREEQSLERHRRSIWLHLLCIYYQAAVPGAITLRKPIVLNICDLCIFLHVCHTPEFYLFKKGLC